MRFFTFTLLLLVVISGCSQPAPNKPQAAVTLLAPKDFARELATRKGVLLDVRTPGEYKKGHLKEARLMNLFDDNFETELNALDTSKTYFVYCGVGGRSAEVCEMLEKKGFKHVYDLDGGFTRWKQDSLPYE